MGKPHAIVTRPEPEASQWVAQLAAHGVAATALPLIDIAPCTDAPSMAAAEEAQRLWAVGHWRAAMFVSHNAVRHFFKQNTHSALVKQALIATKTRAWAPGPGTAQALLDAGLPSNVVDGPAPNAPQFDSEHLWQQVQAQVQPGDHVLIVRGRTLGDAPEPAGTGREWISQRIQAAGGNVAQVAVYQRQPPQWSPAQTARAQQAASDGTLWLLSSSEAVGWLGNVLPGQNWAQARALATHPRIAAAAQALGFGHVHTCRPTLADVVASIESAA
jgi:uroporphyrinogen-III synthase